MKLERVSIRDFHKVESAIYDFGDMTYIEGPNGSGKSTILEAVQFALTGAIPGTDKKKASILEHSNEKSMEVILDLSDDGNPVRIRRRIDSKGSTVEVEPSDVSIEDIVTDSDIPVLDYGKYFELTANKQKDWILGMLPASEMKVNLRDELEKLDTCTLEAKELIDEILEGDTADSIAAVKAAHASAKGVQSALNAELKQLQSAKQTLIRYDDVEGSPEYVEDIRRRLSELNAERDVAIEYGAKLQERESLKEAIAMNDYIQEDAPDGNQWHVVLPLESDEGYVSAKAAVPDLKAELRSLENEIYESGEKKTRIETELRIQKETLAAAEKGTCPILGAGCKILSDSIPEQQAKVEEMEAELDATCETFAAANERYTAAEKELETCEARVEGSEHEHKEAEDLKERFARVAAIRKPEKPIEELDSEISDCTDKLQKAAANEQYEKLFSKAQSDELRVQAQLAFIKSAIALLGENGIQMRMAKTPFDALALKMDKILDALDMKRLAEVDFNLEETANSFSFGIISDDAGRWADDRYIPFKMLSSGEQCVLMIAFMTALIQVSDVKTDFVIIDDLLDHLDDAAFHMVMLNLANIPGDMQFLLAGVHRCPETEDVKVIKLPKVSE